MNSSISNFLSNSKGLLDSGRYSTVLVVLGNEACDLDSAVCAIVYAYNLFMLVPRDQRSEPASKVILPVLNIPREEYRFRTEIIYTMERFYIEAGNLVFVDEIDLVALKNEGKLAVTLVDHNILSQSQASLIDNLVEVIDHHKDLTSSSSSFIKTIELAGSCSTLVTEKVLRQNPQILDSQVAGILLSSILLDTVNLDPRAGRMTAKDVEMVKQLKKTFEPEISCVDLYHAVAKAKFDTSGLTNLEILRKDYKDVPLNPQKPMKIGISSTTLSLETFLQRENVESDLKEFSNLKGLDALVVMAMYFVALDGPPLRQIAVFGENEGVETLSKFLKANEKLGLEEVGIRGFAHFYAFNQRNIKASRKVVLPLIIEFLAL